MQNQNIWEEMLSNVIKMMEKENTFLPSSSFSALLFSHKNLIIFHNTHEYITVAILSIYFSYLKLQWLWDQRCRRNGKRRKTNGKALCGNIACVKIGRNLIVKRPIGLFVLQNLILNFFEPQKRAATVSIFFPSNTETRSEVG